MSHEKIEALLDEYLDGALAPEVAREVEAHLEGCSTCRDAIEALRPLLKEAANLPRSIEPPRDLWPDVDARLGSPALGGRSLWSMRYQLAAAAVVLITVSSIITALLVNRRAQSGRSTDPSISVVVRWQETELDYLRATAELMEALDATKGSLAPETAELVESNLRIIDLAILETRAALSAYPGSRELLEMLSATYRKKIELLQQVSRLTTRT